MTAAFFLSYVLYCGVIEVIVWSMLVPWTLMRIGAGRTSWGELQQRLGGNPPLVRDGLLIHAVSAGEMRAASALVARAWGRRPLLLTTGTRAGMAIATRLEAEEPRVKAAVFVPWDRLTFRSWLRATGVSAVIVTEAELWPSLFLACKALNIPLFIVNAQLAPDAARRYRLAPWFFRPVLACASWIGTQDEAGRDAYVAIGAATSRVQIAGNLKGDANTPAMDIPPAIADRMTGSPLVVAGSTHHPEESWAIDQLEPLLALGRVRLVIAPRDIARARAIVRAGARRSALKCVLWSEITRAETRASGDAWQILVVDVFGWLPSLYRYADIVFLGGTVADVGGHNILEPAMLGKPIVVGPHTEALRALVARMRSADALIELPGPLAPFALRTACGDLVDDPGRARGNGIRARRNSDEVSGSVARYESAIAERLAS